MSILQNKQELFNPIKDYWSILGCKDITLYEETNRILSENKLINSYNKYIDNACYHSINYYDNMNLLMCINLSKKESYSYFSKNLSYTHILYGIKTLKLDKNLIPKILYQIQYQHIINYYDLMKEIINDYPFYEKYKNDEIEINVLILVNKKDINVILDKDDDNIILFSNTKDKKKVMSSIFYNDNSLKFLEMQNIENMLSTDYQNNLKTFHEIKNKFMEYDYFTQENIMINSSTILMLLGFRKNNDIDIYIDKVKNSEKIIETCSKFENIDLSVKNTHLWPNYWDTWLDEWAQKAGAKYFEEIVGFNDYHFYYCGLKLMNIHVDIQRRIVRSRPASLTDLYMLNKTYNMNIMLPKIPDTFYEYKSVENLSEKEKDKILEQGGIYNSENREYKIERKTNVNSYLKKIQEYLNDRYNKELSIDDIKSIFIVKKKIKIKTKK